MTDVHEPKVRSYNMSRIKGKNTKPETEVRKYLFSKGFRFRIHVKNLPGTPDIVLPKHRTIVNVNGCFWHGHENCKYFKLPNTRTEWWKEKISKTILRYKNSTAKLTRSGWQVLTVWECELHPKKSVKTLQYIEYMICQI